MSTKPISVQPLDVVDRVATDRALDVDDHPGRSSRAGRCATLVSCAFDSGAADDLGSDPHEIPQNGALATAAGKQATPNG